MPSIAAQASRLRLIGPAEYNYFSDNPAKVETKKPCFDKELWLRLSIHQPDFPRLSHEISSRPSSRIVHIRWGE
jgi:hypothetical protein